VAWTKDMAAVVRATTLATNLGAIKVLEDRGEAYDVSVATSGGGRALVACTE